MKSSLQMSGGFWTQGLIATGFSEESLGISLADIAKINQEHWDVTDH